MRNKPLQNRSAGALTSSGSFGLPKPRRGGLEVAQGKAAEAAALGKTPSHPVSFCSSGLAPLTRAKPEEQKEVIFLGPLPRALRLPWATIISSLRDFSLVRSARIVGQPCMYTSDA